MAEQPKMLRRTWKLFECIIEEKSMIFQVLVIRDNISIKFQLTNVIPFKSGHFAFASDSIQYPDEQSTEKAFELFSLKDAESLIEYQTNIFNRDSIFHEPNEIIPHRGCHV